MNPLRILFVAPYVPSRMRIRPFAFIRELARSGHAVSLVCLAQPAQERAYLEEIAPFCRAVHCIPVKRLEAYRSAVFSLPGRVPLSVAYCSSAEFQKTIHRLVLERDWDLIHTEFIRAVPYTRFLRDLPRLYDAVDSLVLAYQRSLSVRYLSPLKRLTAWLELLKMKHYEIEAARDFDRVLVSSPVDQQMLSAGGENTHLLPNGVNLEYFAYSDQPREPSSIVFVGKMNYYVNVASMLWFYHHVFPLIRSQHPEVKLKIVGRDPVKAICALAADPAVEVTGTVPDVRPYLSRAAVAVGPMVTGSGIQNKILEAMSVGTPCVVTPIVSQALQAEVGQEISVADTAPAFASAVLELVENPSLRKQQGINGRCYVEQHHNWLEIGNQLNQHYREVLQSGFSKSVSSLEVFFPQRITKEGV